MVMVRRWTGRESRALRHAMRLSVGDFAAKLGAGARSVTKWEAQREQAQLRPDSQALLDTMLERAGAEVHERFSLLLGAASGETAAEPEGTFGRTAEIQTQGLRPGAWPADDDQPAVEEEDMGRRHLINLAALGIAKAVSFAALESVRHDVHAAVSGDAFVDLDEWERIAWEYGYSYSVTPTKTLLDELAVDLLVVRRQLDQTTSEATRRDLQRVIARLSAFVAMCWADLGNLRAEHRWWRTARTAADASHDPEIQTWVRGREVIQALYEPGPLSRVIDSADRTLAQNAPIGLGICSVLGARAQALAKLGRAEEAERSLILLRETFAKLPARIAEDTATMYGWSEHRLLHTESYVYTYLGDHERAGEAQDRVLDLYPRVFARSRYDRFR